MKQISSTLKAFQNIDPDLIRFENHNSWSEYLDNKLEKRCATLLQKDILKPDRVEEVLKVGRKLKSYFSTNELLKPVYWDIHFDNFIVNPEFGLRAIIDLENVRSLPLDYPLFVVKRQVATPGKYLTEEYEKFANTIHYRYLWQWYKKYYPEMFDFENLELRLKFYRLLNELHLMSDWSNDTELQESFSQLMNELSNI